MTLGIACAAALGIALVVRIERALVFAEEKGLLLRGYLWTRRIPLADVVGVEGSTLFWCGARGRLRVSRLAAASTPVSRTPGGTFDSDVSHLQLRTVAGHGGKLGPLTVTTSAQSVSLSLSAPGSVRLVDASGQPVTAAINEEKLYVDVPQGTAAGSAQLTASAVTSLPVGRAFAAIDGSSQTMILAGTAPVSVSSQAQAQWAPKGAVPAADAATDCKKGGVDVTLSNGGDQPWTAQVGGESATLRPGASTTVFVKEKEGAAYSVTVTGPNGFSKTFTGALTCTPTGGSHLPSASPTPSVSASPSGPGLAETGASSATPVIAGVGAGCILLGAAAVFVMRKRARGRNSA